MIGGKVLLKNLTEGIYYVYETDTATGYYLEDQKDIYPDSEDPNKFVEIYNCVYLGSTSDSYESTEWLNCKMEIDQISSVTLTLEKKDKNNNSIKLSGVGLKIYGKLKDTSGWVKEDGTLGNINDANEWKTGPDRNSSYRKFKERYVLCI